MPYIQILFHLKHPFFLLKLNLSNILGLKRHVTYFVITEHIDGSRFLSVAVWSHIVLTLHHNNVVYKESNVYNSYTRCLNVL